MKYLTELYNNVIMLTVLGLIQKEGEKMDYTELAKQFLHGSYQLRSRGHQKKIDNTMQGETFVLLYILRQDDVVMPSEISNVMNISSARVAAILNNLEDKGFITRHIDKKDRRKILVELTQEGIEMAEMHNERVINITARMLELLGEHDAKEMVRIIVKLAELAPQITNC